VPDAARRISRHAETVRRRIRSGRRRSQRVGTHHLVDEDELCLVAVDQAPQHEPVS
jgi:hypothetical protein